MKYIKLIILTFVFFSCTEMLEQVDPTGPTGDDYFQNEQELIFAVNSVYAALSPGTGLYGGTMVGVEMLADNIYSGSGTGDGSTGAWSDFSFDPASSGVERFYDELYVIIARANQVILNAPNVPGISEEKLKNYLGQVHFIRGYAYFLLTLLYEEVPKILEPVQDPTGVAIAKSSASEIYDLVISELEFAEKNLPDEQEEKGRITEFMATAMLAKVYLYGADELQKSEWFGLAKTKASEVIGSGLYSLYSDPNKTPYENLMDIYALENQTVVGKEEVFYVQHYNNGGGWNDGDVATEIPMQLNARQSRSLNLWGYGWGYVFESVGTIWEDGDAREDFNLWFDGEDVIINGEVKGQYAQTGQARPNAKANGFCIQKFWHPEAFKRVNGRSNQNMPVIRYADVLLMHTEADLMEDNNLSNEGLGSFNEVRNRAGLPSLTTGEVTRDRILQERRVEFFGESQRWFDLM